jgi:hypothetical protein
MAHIQALVPGTVGDAICQGGMVMLARHIVASFERDAPLPDGGGDRFSGYAIIGLPFQSGHVLALRRFPVSSIGPGYTAVWHRDPSGRWTFYSTVPPEVSCARYFGREVERNVVASADIAWGDSMSFTVFVGTAIRWHVTLGTSLATRLLSTFAGVIPEQAWNRPAVLRLMGMAARATLGTGRLNLTGLTPNGYRFAGAPRRLWLIESSQAVVDGVSLGPVGPLVNQASLGDFLLPQKGLFAVGRTRFEQSLNRGGAYGNLTGSGKCPVSIANAELLREIAGGKAERIGRVGPTERGESRIGHIKTGRWRLKGGDVLRD